jgi:beta-barrel assembly-enhancing protease
MIKKTLVSALAACLFFNSLPISYADDANNTDALPDIGTTASSTLTVAREMEMGDYYLRQLRASAPLINDVLLLRYINQLGQLLVSHAWSVKTPFHFWLLQSNQLNAFAFFGGNVVLHSDLFRYTDTESQLASVMAHEISHITQRHLARMMENQKRNAPLVWAGILSALLITLANPNAGMAGVAGTMGGSAQQAISFTRENEQEADRIGLGVLSRAGFNPEAMPDFLQKLVDQERYNSMPSEMLLTHPLPLSRLADARNRADQLPAKKVPSSEDFYLARIRILSTSSSNDKTQQYYLNQLIADFSKGNRQQRIAADYGRALLALNHDDFQQAQAIMTPLLAQDANNDWWLDIMTDIDIGLKQPDKAIARLIQHKDNATNQVIAINLANALLENQAYQKAEQRLQNYTWRWPNDQNGWDLLSAACAKNHHQAEQRFADAQGLALQGKLDQAILALTEASNLAPLGSQQQARYDARIDELHKLQLRYRQFH